MGRVNQAMRRARQSGIVTEFDSIAADVSDVSVLAAEPFPAENVEAPAPQDPPKPEAPSQPDDSDIKEIYFGTYHEKVWNGRR